MMVFLVLGGVFLVVFFVGALVYFMNKTAFDRMLGAGSAQVGKLGRVAIEADPIAVMQDRRDKAAESLTEAIRVQGEYKGHLNSLNRQVEESSRLVSQYDAKIKGALSKNDEIRASQYVVQMQREKEHLEANVKQQQTMQKNYDVNLQKIKSVQADIKSIDERASRLKVDLKMSEAEKNLSAMMAKVSFGVDMSSVREAENAVMQRIDRNRGAVQVQNDLDVDSITEAETQEAEKQDEARAILEQYKANMATGGQGSK